jgi:hypothetical protein
MLFVWQSPAFWSGFVFLASSQGWLVGKVGKVGSLARSLSVTGFWLLVPSSNNSRAPETRNNAPKARSAAIRSVITGFYFFSKISKRLYFT